jgi:DnaJ-class molecular chaperone
MQEQYPITCELCNGSGEVGAKGIYLDCAECMGTGKTLQARIFENLQKICPVCEGKGLTYTNRKHVNEKCTNTNRPEGCLIPVCFRLYAEPCKHCEKVCNIVYERDL